MIRVEESLEYHAGPRPGKIEVRASKPCLSPREIRLAYLPGAAFPARAIAGDPAEAFRYTAKGNLVAVVTNGTAVPGLGDVGPLGAKPMQEGMAVLFKRLADIDVFDLELDARDPEQFIATVRILSPTFGAINLKDVRAPEGLEIYRGLRDDLAIPVFHENLYGPAVVAVAALINGLDLVEKRMEQVRIVVSGAGTVGLGCLRLLAAFGVPKENLLAYDRQGLLHPDREDLTSFQAEFAAPGAARDLAAGLEGADVFIGASAPGVLTAEMILSMARRPLVLAMSSPDPEIGYAEARATRHDVVVFTSRPRDPNAIQGVLSFPYILRAALDVQASCISESMMLAAARSLAELAREEVPDEVNRAYGHEPFSFGPEYLLPKAIDPRILLWESVAVARQAVAEGVARLPLEPESYRERLTVRVGPGREVMRHLILKARRVQPRIVFPEGTNETVLRACAIIVDEGIGSPVLLGRNAEIERAAERLAVDLRGTAIVDPALDQRAGLYAREYLRLRGRRGVTPQMAAAKLAEPAYFASLMVSGGDADMMIHGFSGHFAEAVRRVVEVIGPAPGVRRIASAYMVIRTHEVVFLADCAVNIEPDAEELAEIAVLTANTVRSLGIEPRVAMLTFSNFGSVPHPLARKVRRATELARKTAPDLLIDGELQLLTALDREVREQYFPFCRLREDANVLIFPDLQSGNVAMQTLQKLADAVVVGPLLTGTRRPAHVMQYGTSVEEVVNLVALAAVYGAEQTHGALERHADVPAPA
jgi:malate dehydrogenase (oxaloacetate-decarboxylating)(NADP+)